VLDHVGIRVRDREASERFYGPLLAGLGAEPPTSSPQYTEWGQFAIAQADAEHPPTRGLHVGFFARTTDLVDAFWRTGTELGHPDDGAPGPRPEYGPDYFGAFLRDPDGNSAEAVHLGNDRRDGAIDHLWIRVADVAAAKAFYETIAPYAGLRLRTDEPERAQFVLEDASFSLVAGEPTAHLHLAFGVPGMEAIEAFHRAATSAGYADNGGPGERPEYHPGYLAAYVLDPDGTNVEAVHHAG
jgi:catechol 2,3-dioxygenase-like lactoylglutathione lyase family enzyme